MMLLHSSYDKEERRKKKACTSMEYMSRMPHSDSRCIDTRAAFVQETAGLTAS